jgi:small-conductance mechanosensitive channel
MIEELINDFIHHYNNGNWKSALLISSIIIAFGLVLHFVFFKTLSRIIHRKDKELLRKIRDKFKVPSLLLILTVALEIILFSFAPQSHFTETLKHVFKLFIIFSVAWLLNRLVSLGKNIVLKNFDIYQKDNLKARRVYTQFKILERIVHFIIILIAIGIALTTFESIRKVGISLFASAGVAGVIIGFAAQKLLATVIAGFQIAITQPIRIDDVVIVENEWGWIEEINLTFVVVRIWDKRRLVLPTTYFIEKPFQNWTRVSSDINGTVFIYTDYNVSFKALREELTRILKNDENWDGKVNNLQVTNATEKTVEIRALVSATDSPTAWDLRVNVREKLIEFLQNNYPESLPKTRIRINEKEEK